VDLSGKRAKKSMHAPIEIETGNKSLVKTVFLVIFLIAIVVAAGLAGLYYWWTTHATFEYEVHPVIVLEGQNVNASDFLYPGEAERGVTADFQEPGFEPQVGFQFVPLTLHHTLRSLETAATLYVLTPVEYKTHEFAVSDTVLRPIEFISNADVATQVTFDIRFTENPLPPEDYPVGDHILHLALNGEPFKAILRVEDTTPPSAFTNDVTVEIGGEVSAEEFITEAYDASPIVSITFAEEPDTRLPQDQTVRIAIEDYYGNTALYTAELIILLNQLPPEIENAPETVEAMVNTEIDYIQEAIAMDDFGREIEIMVDDSRVNTHEEGTYTATLIARDYTGNTAEAEVTVHILSVAPETVYEMVDEVLNRILRDGMSGTQVVRAINDWIRWTLSSSDTTSDSESALAGAYKALTERRGDYHVHNSLAEVMLTRAGIENMRIDRIPNAEGESTFSWRLVHVDGKWYHFDAFPNGLGMGGGAVSMFTNTQAKSFTGRITGTADYYTFNPELYPEIAE